jgi:ATP-dependent exoDNAse (exonuclease V) alpha subunit
VGNPAADFQLGKVRRELEQMPSANREFAKVLTEHASHFDRRDAIQAVAASFPDGAPAADVEARADAFLASGEVVPISTDSAGQRFTTLEIWELERGALASTETMLDQSDRAVVGELATARVLDARPTMKPDQVGMVRRLLVEGEGLVVVVGEAGTGKSYATVAAAEGWAQVGVEVRVAAPSWRAANVLRSDGLDATSVARLLGELNRQGGRRDALPRGSVLVVDEAGMVDSRSLARLIDHADDAKAKLLLIGDPEQLPEIEAGGLFASLAERSDPVWLDQVIRHDHDLDREGAKRIRDGQGREALRLYREEDRILVAETPEDRREAIVADWWQSYRRGEDSQLIAKRNAEVEKLNEAARALMRSEGRLGAEEIEVGGKPFAAGDQVITRVNDHANRIYNRERWRVAEVDAGAGSLVLDGIDTRGRVCVDAVYLGRWTEREGRLPSSMATRSPPTPPRAPPSIAPT